MRAALWNAGHAVFKGFLDTTVEELETTLQTNVVGAFAFALLLFGFLLRLAPLFAEFLELCAKATWSAQRSHVRESEASTKAS